METMETFETVRKLIGEQLVIPVEKITLDSKIVDDLGADSLDIVEMLMSVEEHFGVTISEEVATSIVTIKDIVNYLDSTQK